LYVVVAQVVLVEPTLVTAAVTEGVPTEVLVVLAGIRVRAVMAALLLRVKLALAVEVEAAQTIKVVVVGLVLVEVLVSLAKALMVRVELMVLRLVVAEAVQAVQTAAPHQPARLAQEEVCMVAAAAVHNIHLL
jgi:hypothetical protein